MQAPDRPATARSKPLNPEVPEEQGPRIAAFADALAAHAPAPGGGAAAAAAVAMGAALVQMASHYANPETLDASGRDRVESARALCQRAQSDAVAAVDADSDAYTAYRKAVRLPRSDEAQKDFRRREIQNSAKAASATSVSILEAALAVIDAGRTVAEIGNPRLASDAEGGALLARSAAGIALANLDANLRSCPEDSDRQRWQGLAEAARRRL
ncbi:MAG: cyclodeaminase/cyclohydrolase family protein [Chloroflexi bacterium]|nr:cyclodeaminase/cyclohydrolase family protein [Chloroflexota bacterium]